MSKVQIGALWPSPKVDKKSRKNDRKSVVIETGGEKSSVSLVSLIFFFALKLPVYRLKDAGLDS